MAELITKTPNFIRTHKIESQDFPRNRLLEVEPYESEPRIFLRKLAALVIAYPFLAEEIDLGIKLVRAEEMALKVLEHKAKIVASLPDSARMFVDDDLEEMFLWLTDNTLSKSDRKAVIELLRNDFHVIKEPKNAYKKTSKKDLSEIWDFTRTRLIFNQPFKTIDRLQLNLETLIDQVQFHMDFKFHSIKTTLYDSGQGGFSDVKVYFTEGDEFYEIQVNTLQTVLCQTRETPIYVQKGDCMVKIVQILSNIGIKSKFEIRFLESCDAQVSKLLSHPQFSDQLQNKLQSKPQNQHTDQSQSEFLYQNFMPVSVFVSLSLQLQEIKKLNTRTLQIFAEAEQIIVRKKDGEMLKEAIYNHFKPQNSVVNI